MNYKIKINDVDYSDHLQVPFNLSFTLDETLDVGSCVLEGLSSSDVFKPYSLVEIIVENSDGTDGKIYHMFVESDNVQEIDTISGSQFNHNLTLVELTKYMETITVSDFSVTDNTIFEEFNKNTITTTTNITSKDFTWYPDGVGVLNTPVVSNKLSIISTQSSCSLPSVSWTADARIGFYNRTAYVSYYYEVYRGNTKYTVVDNTFLPDVEGIYTVTLKPVLPQTLSVTTWGVFGRSYDLSNSYDGTEYVTFQLEAQESVSDVYQQLGEILDKVLILNEAESYDFPSSSSETGAYTPAFSYASDLFTRIDYTTRCPEVDFTGGKTLKEVLTTLGREVNAIPRMKYNIDTKQLYIDFDIIEEDIIVDEYELNFEEYLKSKDNNMTSYFNAMNTTIESVISDELAYYPFYDKDNFNFITPRSIDENNGTMTIENCGIVLPHNIERINRIFCRPGNASTISYEITDYICEESVFNSLSSTTKGSGQQLMLYYTKGSNTIHNIGNIPESTNILGFTSSVYVINNILNAKEAYVSDTQDPRQYGFYIEYVPQKKMNVLVEQENQSDFDMYVSTPYNADVNVVSSTLLGNDVQRQLKATSGNTIDINIDLDDINKIPLLGDNVNIYDDHYYINSIGLSFGYQPILSIQFSKDWNKVSDRIGINQQYREYAIPNESVVNRNINMEKMIFVTDKDTLSGEWVYDTELIEDYSEYLRGIINTNYPTNDCMILNTWSNDYMFTYSAKNYALNSNIIRHSNSFILSASTRNNYSIGQRISQNDDFELNVPSTWIRYNVNQDIIYTDDIGKVNSCKLVERRHSMNYTFNSNNTGSYIVTGTSGGNNFPQINSAFIDSTVTKYIHKLKLNKDAKESLTFNVIRSMVSKTNKVNIGSGSFSKFWLYESIGTLELHKIEANHGLNTLITNSTKLSNVTVTTDGDTIKLTFLNVSESSLTDTQTLIVRGSNEAYIILKFNLLNLELIDGNYILPDLYLHCLNHYEHYKYQNHDKSE